MADIRESFATLENVSTQEGAVLGARTEGEAAAGIQGSVGFAFKDSSGNVVLPQLSPAGEIYVSTEKPGDNLHARGENAGSATGSLSRPSRSQHRRAIRVSRPSSPAFATLSFRSSRSTML